MKTLAFSLLLLSLPVSAATITHVDQLDPEVLSLLDQPGVHSFATFLGLGDIERQTGSTPLPLSVLAKANNSKYNSLRTRISDDVFEIKKVSGEKMAFSSEEAEKLAPAGNVARHFDPFWLNSSQASFHLIAVVNRIDKMANYANTCGELRFIYRLAYNRGNDAKSTLPFFFNVVFDYKKNGDSCAGVAQSWQRDSALTDAKSTADWLLQGPLNSSNITFKQLELNLQVVRFPSGQKTDFGGQAIYMLRIFQESGGQFSAIPLENTINVGAISKSASLKSALIAQLKDPKNLEKIDQGTFVLENSEGKLLADRALSFSTSGRGRLVNKPYTALFGGQGSDFETVNYADLKFVKSPRGLIERLNNMTCMGCHQNGGTAGFHMLGMGGKKNSAFNQVILPFSSHYHAERQRRSGITQAVAKNQTPDMFIPPSFFPAKTGKLAGPRDLCVDKKNDFSMGVTCDAGLECKTTVINSANGISIGECVHKNKSVAGHVCREGKITNAPLNLDWKDLYNLKGFKDTINVDKTFTELACGKPVGGVPLGRIAKTCEENSAEGRLEFVDTLKEDRSNVPTEICAMRGGPQFDECAKTKNPALCLSNAKIVRAKLDSCFIGSFCREDYICQNLPQDISRVYSGETREKVRKRALKLGAMGVGFCVPNYFVFNMRTDGHIIPDSRK